jgi:hypothetical protein
MRDLDQSGIQCNSAECPEIVAGARGEVGADFHDRDDLPLRRQGGIEGAERVRDPAPFLDRAIPRVASIYDVPHERPEDAES